MAVDRSFAARNQVPEGVKDRLPREAARLSGLGERLLGAFAAWGYRPVTTPAFEFVETVSAGLTAAIREDLYQFFDRRGRTLALRPDMTTPIARLVATKLAAEPLPLRLSYWADVFRHQGRKSGALHEVWQAGVELVGAAGATADAEVVALACEALAATGLEGYKVGLGHVDFVEGLFAHAGLSAATVEELKEALVLRDFVAYEKGVATAAVEPATADLLLSLMSFHGSWQDALSRYSGVNNPRVRRALAQLGETLQYLAAAGVQDQVALDLGLARSFGYYTGVVFEAFAPGVGLPVLGGGRYDDLLAEFGPPQPATGFAMDAEALLAALERQGKLAPDPVLEYLVAATPDCADKALARAVVLRRQGKSVELELLGRTGEALMVYARQRGARQLLVIGPESEALSPMQPGRPHRSGGVPSIH